MTARYLARRWAIFGGPIGPVTLPVPASLAAAIRARYYAAPASAGFTKIYRDQAGDRAKPPYLVFSIRRGPLALATSSSNWFDDRVTFRAWADAGEAADLLILPVASAYQGAGLSFASGVTTPLVESDRSQGKAPARGPGAAYVFWSEVVFSVRTRQGRPS